MFLTIEKSIGLLKVEISAVIFSVNVLKILNGSSSIFFPKSVVNKMYYCQTIEFSCLSHPINHIII